MKEGNMQYDKNYSLMWVKSLPRGCDPEVSAEVIWICLQGGPPWEGPPVSILDFTTHSGFHGHTAHLLSIHSFTYSLTCLTHRITEYRSAFPRCWLVIPMLLTYRSPIKSKKPWPMHNEYEKCIQQGTLKYIWGVKTER